MSRIIQPFGKPTARIVIEFDLKGQAKVEASAVDPFGKHVPMPPMQIAALLANIIANTLGGMLQAMARPAKEKLEGDNGDTKT